VELAPRIANFQEFSLFSLKMRSTKRGIELYLSGILIYGLGIIIFRLLPYYQRILQPQTQTVLLYLYFSYLIFAPIIYYFRATRYTETKPILFLRGLKRICTRLTMEKEEKTAFLFMLVKLFFLPLLLNFFLSHYQQLWQLLSKEVIHFYPLALTVLFTIDTLIFALGYAFEFKLLNNMVKSVEPTLFGWIVTLICYPPFNTWIGKYILWGASEQVSFWNQELTFVFRIIIIIILFIYVSATIALGLKASNLTNRGIVQRFPYSLIRHPAYTSKVLVWWLTLLPVMSWPFALGIFFWTVIYYFRAITEEKHLSQDPDYQEYCKKVKWRFIPGVY